MVFHILHTQIPVPERFNNPFDYVPHPLCRLAFSELKERLLRAPYRDEIDRGKMFGVLVVEYRGQLGYLQAYSGQISALDEASCKSSEDGGEWVPPVFDYLQEDGHFKQEEREISAINNRISTLETSSALAEAHRLLAEKQQECERKIEDYRQLMHRSKAERNALRSQGIADEPELIRQSQFQKAELRRLKKALAARLAAEKTEVERLETEITALRRERKLRSDRLQGWLFAQFRMLNARGESRSLTDIFRSFYPQEYNQTPPSGSGECCEPKLLQYAFAHHMRPLCMSTWWWGRSPASEIRHHLAPYPACQGKCKPILAWMLQGLDVDESGLVKDDGLHLIVLYEDNDIIVVNKPAGMLSVPGKGKQQSVQSVLASRLGEDCVPMMPHRLDMATSGLLVVAKNRPAYINLQQQFRDHKVRKRYIALLEPSDKPIGARRGTISLPLTADKLDRPRQIVDRENGKYAITEYEFLSSNRVSLRPLTGRTHQLRVHCAHAQGLSRPILGDALYGHRAGRLYLHAEHIEFRHPAGGRLMSFTSNPDF